MFRNNKTLLYICILGLILRLIYIFAFATYIDPPDWEYGDIACNLVAGNGFARSTYFSDTIAPTSSHAPFYPYALAIAYSWFPKPWSFLIVQFIQTILSLFVIIIAFRTALLLFNRNAAYFTALGVALYPPLIYYSGSMTPTIFLLFFLGLAVWLLLAHRHHSWNRSLFMGLSYGCALLCDPIAFSLIPAAAFWCIVTPKKITRYMTGALVLAILVILPWSLRNIRVHKTCVPITTQFSINFWIGNNPRATGTDYYRVVRGTNGHATLMTHTLPRVEKKKLGAMSEIQRARYFAEEALTFIYNKPLGFVWRLIQKGFYYWWFSPSSINGSPTALQYRVIHGIFYVPLLFFAILSFAVFKIEHRPVDLNLIFALIFVISAIYIITHVGLARYRIPVELYLLVIAGSIKSRFYKLLFS